MSDKEGLVKFYSGLSPDALRWALPPYDRPRVERFFSSPEQLIGLVGVVGGEVVGHLHIFRFMSRMRHVGELTIYLRQDYHNVGLGSRMMRGGLDLARSRGLKRVQLSVIAGNVDAVRLYKKLGFRKEGERAGSYRGEDGHYYDALDMGIIIG